MSIITVEASVNPPQDMQPLDQTDATQTAGSETVGIPTDATNASLVMDSGAPSSGQTDVSLESSLVDAVVTPTQPQLLDANANVKIGPSSLIPNDALKAEVEVSLRRRTLFIFVLLYFLSSMVENLRSHFHYS